MSYLFSFDDYLWHNENHASGLLFLYVCRSCDVQKDEEVEFFRAKFAGSQADRADRAVKAEAEANKVAEQLKNTKISG